MTLALPTRPSLRRRAITLCLLASLPTAAVARPRRVEPGRQKDLFALWQRPTVRTGADRQVTDSLGTPALYVPPAHAATPPSVLLGTAEGEVLAVVQASGALRWRHVHGAAIDGVVTLHAPRALGLGAGETPSVAVVGGRDGVLVALDADDGRVRWRATLDAPCRAATVAADGRLYVTTEANQLAALDGATGRVLWTQGRPPPVGLALLGHARPALADGCVVAAFADGFVVAADVRDGRMLWERPLSLRGGRFVDADASPIVIDGRVYVASVTDGVYALALSSGQTLWHRPLTEVLSLCAVPADGARKVPALLLTGDVFGKVVALRLEDGRPYWRLDAGAGPALDIGPLADGIAFVAGERGLVYADAATGEPRSVYPLGGAPGGGLATNAGAAAHVARDGRLFVWQARAQAAGDALFSPATAKGSAAGPRG